MYLNYFKDKKELINSKQKYLEKIFINKFKPNNDPYYYFDKEIKPTLNIDVFKKIS